MPVSLLTSVDLPTFGKPTIATVPTRPSSSVTAVSVPSGARGYREASAEIQREVRRLWEWLGDVHAQGRPRDVSPPG